MAIPNNILSTTPVLSEYLPPDDVPRFLLEDYEQGGLALNDTTEDMNYQKWTLTYADPDVIVTPASGAPSTLFSFAGITEVSLAFDQTMRPFITYVRNDVAWYWWYDPISVQEEHVQMAADVLTPRCCLDDKRPGLVSNSDIILAYVRSGDLYYREQRDRFTVEYPLDTGVASLYSVAMGDNLRLQFSFRR